VPVHHRRVRSGRGSSACAAAAYRHRAHARVDAKTRPACRARPGTYPIGHPHVSVRALVLLVLRGDHPHRPRPYSPPGAWSVWISAVTSLAVLSTGEITREPASSGGHPTGAAPPTAPSPQAYRPRQAHATGAAGAVASDPGPHRRPHTAVTNARRDGLHKLTTRLARTHGTVVDLRRRRQ
jgi:hypothetical protein